MNERKCERQIKSMLRLIYSAVVLLALNCKMECVVGGEDSILLNGIYKLYHSFSSHDFLDILIVVAVYVLISYVDKQDKRWDKQTAGFAVFLSVIYVVSMSYSKYDSAVFLFENSFQILLSGICIVGYCLIIYYSLRLLMITVHNSLKSYNRISSGSFWNKYLWLISFLIIFICWLPWILMNYPGTSAPDDSAQLAQFFGDSVFTAHHPPLSTYIMGITMIAGKSMLDYNFGFFLYILMQTILGALIFSYSIKKLYELGIRLAYCMVGVSFYALLPLWGGTVQARGKDLLYTEVIALFVIYLVNVIVKKQCGIKEGIELFVAGLLASLLRNNGIYAVLPTIIILLLYLKNSDRKRMLVVMCSTVFVYMGIVKILYPCLGIQSGSVKEALSIPFLQTARYVDMYGDEVTEYEKEVISSVLDYEALETYNPKHADSVKNTYKMDDSKLPQYFKVWFQMFLKHPGCYVSALLNKGGGYLAPVDVGFPAPIGTEQNEYVASIGVNNPFGDKFADLFVHFEYASMEMPFVKFFCMAGTYTWIVLICIWLLIKKKRYDGILLFIPEIMNIIVCIASPTWHIRYALPLIAVVPLMIGWTYYQIMEEDLS